MRGAAYRLRLAWARASREEGSVLIETALAYMVGITMVLAIIEVSMMCFTVGVVDEAARVGVRYATIHGTDSSNCSGPSSGCGDSAGANVVGQVTGFVGRFTNSAASMNVAVTYPDAGGSTAPSRVLIAVTYTYRPLFTVAGSNLVFNVAEQGRIVY